MSFFSCGRSFSSSTRLKNSTVSSSVSSRSPSGVQQRGQQGTKYPTQPVPQHRELGWARVRYCCRLQAFGSCLNTSGPSRHCAGAATTRTPQWTSPETQAPRLPLNSVRIPCRLRAGSSFLRARSIRVSSSSENRSRFNNIESSVIRYRSVSLSWRIRKSRVCVF